MPKDQTNLAMASSEIPMKEAMLNKELHDSVQGLLNLNQKSSADDDKKPAAAVFSKTDTAPVSGHNGVLNAKE